MESAICSINWCMMSMNEEENLEKEILVGVDNEYFLTLEKIRWNKEKLLRDKKSKEDKEFLKKQGMIDDE